MLGMFTDTRLAEKWVQRCRAMEGKRQEKGESDAIVIWLPLLLAYSIGQASENRLEMPHPIARALGAYYYGGQLPKCCWIME